MMPNDNQAMGLRRYGSEEQLVYDQEESDDNELEQEMEAAEQEEIEFETEETPHHHVHFVTDPHLSSWSYKYDDQEARTKLGNVQYKVGRIVDHFVVRVISLLLVVADIIIVIVNLATTDTGHRNFEDAPLEIFSLIIATIFLFEVGLRIFAFGSHFFKRWIEILDMVVVIVSFILTVVFAIITLKEHSLIKLVVAARFIRILLFIRIVTGKDQLERATRRMISQNKRRYQTDGFDLDLTYVTERVIAMSFPSSGKHKLYRNPISEVVRFLDTKHQDHYKVYNMCSERSYDPTLFHNRVERILIDDHNVPRLSQLLYFCHNVREWMEQDPKNIIAVHCKGGKGRTGTAICSWLLASGQFEQARQSLGFFGFRRTDYNIGKSFQGVQTPSQSRYVAYVEQIFTKLNRRMPPPVPLKLRTIKIDGISGLGDGDGKDLRLEVIINGSIVFHLACAEPGRPGQIQHFADLDKLVITIGDMDCPTLTGDIKIKFYSASPDLTFPDSGRLYPKLRTRDGNVPVAYDKCAFFFWFYTSFIENKRLFLRRDELDNPHKPKTWKVYKDNFAIDLTFKGQ